MGLWGGSYLFRIKGLDPAQAAVWVSLFYASLTGGRFAAGFVVIGPGCAPIYPCMLHETPNRFGAKRAPSIMGFQMAVAYIGSTFLPPAFGFIASFAGLRILPGFLLVYVTCVAAASELPGKKRAMRPSP